MGRNNALEPASPPAALAAVVAVAAEEREARSASAAAGPRLVATALRRAVAVTLAEESTWRGYEMRSRRSGTKERRSGAQ